MRIINKSCLIEKTLLEYQILSINKVDIMNKILIIFTLFIGLYANTSVLANPLKTNQETLCDKDSHLSNKKILQSIQSIPSWRSHFIVSSQQTSVFSSLHDLNPCQDTQIITQIPKGEKIKVLGSIGNYYSIQYLQNHTEIEGFVAKSEISLSLIDFNFYFTLVCMVAVLITGRFLIRRIKFLQDYNIPEPVVGGIIAALGILAVYKVFNIEFKFDASLKEPLMLAFFASIGLSADFASLKKGGKMLGLFLVLVSGLLVMQNVVGLGISYIMGVNPLLGMLGGSITMSGGHGTGVGWADVFKAKPYNFSSATEVAMACATFGLIMGGIIGGPVARFLIKHNNLKIPGIQHNNDNATGFETPTKERLITPASFIESLALIAIALLIGKLLEESVRSLLPKFNLPTFVYCLFVGVILRNVLSACKIHQVFDREVSVLGNVSLSLFLAFAMMTLNLWELVALALPLIVILSAQALLMICYAIFVTFRFCGKDYDAAVLAAGHCGFGLGATPTAMVNMQTVTSHYGPSHMAFVIVPLVGAFFIDLLNVGIIQGCLWLLKL